MKKQLDIPASDLDSVFHHPEISDDEAK